MVLAFQEKVKLSIWALRLISLKNQVLGIAITAIVLVKGKDNVREFLKENPDIAKEIEAKIREKLGVKAGSAVVTDVLGEEEEVE
jgi:hypothetical protein